MFNELKKTWNDKDFTCWELNWGLCGFSSDFAVVREVPPPAMMMEVPRVALLTLICFSNMSLWVKSSDKGIFWAFVTGFLCASM